MKKKSGIDVVIDEIQRTFPEFLRPKDLVKTGLYKSTSDLSWARKRGQAPPSIKLLNHKVIFPRASLCEWLREKSQCDFDGDNWHDKPKA